MIIRSRTFKGWLKCNLKDYMSDIATHGASSGFPGLTYYTDTVKLYDKFESEIWDKLAEESDAFGHTNVLEFISTFRGAEISTPREFKNLLVWWYAETISREETEQSD